MSEQILPRSTARRFEVLGGPGGYLNALPVGDPRRSDSRYRRWVTLATINRPISAELVDWSYRWVLRNFEVRS